MTRVLHFDPDSGALSAGVPTGEVARRGCYIFLGEPVEPTPAFGRVVGAAVAGSGVLRLVWARRLADLAASRWRLSCAADGTVAEPVALGGGDLGVTVPAGVRLSWDASGAAMVLEGDGITARLPGAGELPAREGRARVLLAGDGVGALELELADAPVAASFRYFWGPASALERAVYPVFPAVPRTSGLRIRYSPHAPRERARAWLVGEPERYPTFFRTPFGHPVELGTTENSGFAFQYDPVEGADYAVLDGEWSVHAHGETGPASAVRAFRATGATGATGPVSSVDLMLGTSGLEYARLEEGAPIAFAPGGPAYAQYFGGPGAGPTALVSEVPGIAEPVTTAWVSVPEPEPPPPPPGPVSAAGPAAFGYYTQPERSPFYEPGADPEFLGFMPIFAGPFPGSGLSFPAAPYAGVAAGACLDDYGRFEIEVLGTVRRNAVLQGPSSRAAADAPGPRGLAEIGPTGPLGPSGPVRSAVTPRGLLAGFADDGDWRELRLLQADHGAEVLRLTEIGQPLRGALLSNQLFLVATDKEKLLRACSVQYQLTARSFAVLAAMGGELAKLAQAARYLEGWVYESRPYFDAVLRGAIGEAAFEEYGEDFRRVAASARIVVRDWTFDLSPYLWQENGSFLILKFADLPLAQLVDDVSLWTAQDAFLTESLAQTQQKLKAFIADAAERADSDPDYRYFSETVCHDRRVGGGVETWNGVVCLNCAVPVTQLPPQLQGLAAGIKAEAFRAHHVGINASAVRYDGGRLSIEDSSVFGLIAYEDPGDLYYRGKPYEYKVLLLKVLFANSQVTDFASQIELLVGDLFGERSSLLGGAHGDNLVLNGVWQRHGDVDSYAFSEEGENVFQVASQVLDTVTISKAEFTTIVPDPDGASQTVDTRFLFRGTMRFKALPGFDVFSFGDSADGATRGGLQFANLAVRMSFDPLRLSTREPEFAFDATQLRFEPSLSRAREGSLYQRFPLRVTDLVQGSGADTPDSLGYIRVYTPLAAASVSGTWFGLVMDLNLGSQGGLAARAGFYATLIAAWAPSADDYKVYVGLKLPGSTGAERSLSLMGPLKLKMADIRFLVLDGDRPGKQAYLLRFAGITLNFLSIALPPGARVNALLFGNPDPNASTAALGWYAAYMKDREPAKPASVAALAAPPELLRLR
ncbi:MAG TPA: hypothetical protein VF192_10595 [Longimicrobiales bacterium]